MPKKVYSVCTYPGCGQLVQGKPRCERHPYVEKRKVKRGPYGEKWWRDIRRAYLAQSPWCELKERCEGARARHVDHIIPLREGGSSEPENLQALCHRCHSYKTIHQDRQRDERTTSMKVVATGRIEIASAGINIIVGQEIENQNLALAALDMGFGREVDQPGQTVEEMIATPPVHTPEPPHLSEPEVIGTTTVETIELVGTTPAGFEPADDDDE